MSRVQLALNVADIDSAVEFYSKLFGAEPAKRQPGYANFAITDPPLKLVLMENADARGHGIEGALNHLGVEVETAGEVAAASGRLSGGGLATEVQDQTTCCFAVQDKVWVRTPTAHRGRFTPCWLMPPLRRGSLGTVPAAFLRSAAASPAADEETLLGEVSAGRVSWERLSGRNSDRFWHRRPTAQSLGTPAHSYWRTPQRPPVACTPSSSCSARCQVDTSTRWCRSWTPPSVE